MDRILIVDDSPLDRRLLRSLLEKREQTECQFACDGVEALQMLERQRPDVIVTDLMMPRKDGLQLVSELNRVHPEIPVLLITGQGSEQAAVKALQAGAASYVPKSQLGQLLLETVEHLFDITRERRSQSRLLGGLEETKSRFRLDNDAALIPALVQYLNSAMRGVGLGDESMRIRVCVALEEALNNAIFHGNLEITSEQRSRDLQGYRKLVEQRRGATPFRERSVRVDVELDERRGQFVISDEGPGFDPAAVPDPTDPANLDKPGGRGLLLMRTFMDEVAFSAQGNEVRMVKYDRGAAVSQAS